MSNNAQNEEDKLSATVVKDGAKVNPKDAFQGGKSGHGIQIPTNVNEIKEFTHLNNVDAKTLNAEIDKAQQLGQKANIGNADINSKIDKGQGYASKFLGDKNEK